MHGRAQRGLRIGSPKFPSGYLKLALWASHAQRLPPSPVSTANVANLFIQMPAHVENRRNPEGQEYCPVIQVDYTSQSQLAEALISKQVHTVISALNVDFQSVSDAQLRLIEAAATSGCVRRFAPSEFNVDYDLDDSVLPYLEKKFHVAARRALEKTQLEYTYFYSGMFMDYFGLPRIEIHLRPLYTVLDLEHNEAAVPGDGSAVMALTLTEDVAKFVAASLDLERWPRVLTIVASQPTLNELVQLAETARGGRKLDVRYDSVQDLKRHNVQLLAGNEPIAQHFDGGHDQLKGLLCDLGASIALGAYNVRGAVDAVDLVALMEEKVGSPVRVDGFLQRYWAS